MKKWILLLLSGLFLGLGIYCGIRLGSQMLEYRQGEQLYQDLTQYVQVPTVEVSATRTDTPQTTDLLKTPDSPVADSTLWPDVDFEALQAINPDIVAWIYIADTDINYPIVQGADNSYYLHRLFDGTGNSAGSIFMDYRNPADLTGRNTVLYGHNMKNGTMFAQITRYKEQNFFDTHPQGMLLTPEGNYILDFFAGYVSDLDTDAWKLEFGSEEEYEGWLSNAISRSCFTSGLTPTAGDRVVTLSTCSYEYADARFVLLATLRSPA